MFTSMALRVVLKSSSCILRDSVCLSKLTGTYSTVGAKHWACTSALSSKHRDCCGTGSSVLPIARHYARATKTTKPVFESQLSDLPPTMLKMDYAAVPLAQTVDDVVKKLITLELANHSEKLKLKKEQLIKMVQRDETDNSSPEVKVAILTARIRNYQEHMHKHHKDKANKRWMLMAIDRRKKLLKRLRRVNYDAFESVCQKLGITYTFPPEYYRRITRRWLVKKALCIKVFKEVQKRKAELRLMVKQAMMEATQETSVDKQTT